METTTLHPVVMKLNFPFITRKPSFCGRTLIEGHNTELLHRYVLAMALELKANAADLADCEVQAIRLGGAGTSCCSTMPPMVITCVRMLSSSALNWPEICLLRLRLSITHS